MPIDKRRYPAGSKGHKKQMKALSGMSQEEVVRESVRKKALQGQGSVTQDAQTKRLSDIKRKKENYNNATKKTYGKARKGVMKFKNK